MWDGGHSMPRGHVQGILQQGHCAVNMQCCACSVCVVPACGALGVAGAPGCFAASDKLCCSSRGSGRLEVWPCVCRGTAVLGWPRGAQSQGRDIGYCSMGCPKAGVSGVLGAAGPCCHCVSIAVCPRAGDMGGDGSPAAMSLSLTCFSFVQLCTCKEKGEGVSTHSTQIPWLGRRPPGHATSTSRPIST